MKTACVTGATGCVGRNLVDELLKDRWHVIVLHRKTSDLSKLSGCDVEFREVDLCCADSTEKSIPQNVHAVFHVAGNVSHWRKHAKQQWRDNVLATRNLISASLQKQVGRFIFCSTGATSGFMKVDPKKIKSGYIRTKRLAEIEVDKGADAGLDTVILKPIIVIGRYDYNNYSNFFKFLKDSKFKPSLPGSLMFCHAQDVARGHIQAFESGKRGETYFLFGEHHSWYDVFVKITDLLKVRHPFRPFPVWAYYITSYFMLWYSSISGKEPLLTPELIYLMCSTNEIMAKEDEKSKRDLNYKSASLDDALQDCYDWLIAENRL